MRRIKLGIIGTGIAARDLHWPPLQRLSDRFEIVALCNRTRSKADDFRNLIGGHPRITTDYHELLSWPEVEAVDVAMPIVMNEPVTIDALRSGKHVFVEKPIGHNLDAGRRVVEEGDRQPHLVLLVAENVRYEERIRAAGRLVAGGRIGRPSMVHADVLAPLDRNGGYAGTTWRMEPEHIGGYLSDGGVHQVAALQVIAGRIAAVQGLITGFRPQDDPADTMLANLRFASGAVGHLTYSVGVLQREPSPIRVYGTEGSMRIHNDRVTVIDADGGEEALDFSDATNPFVLEFLDFYRAITAGKPLEVTPRDTLSDLAVIAAAFQSSEEGRTVPIDV